MPMNEQKILSSSKLGLFIVCGLIIVIAAFLVGLYWGQQYGGDGYQQGYNAAWQKAQDLTAHLFPPEPQEVLQLSGKVTDINTRGNSLTLEAEPLTDNPFVQAGPLTRTVQIDENTDITKYTEKDLAEFAAEEEQFQKALTSLGPDQTPPEPPSAYDSEEISLSDLKAGDSVTVESLTDIKNATSFTASRIGVYVQQPSPELTPPEPEPPTE